VFRNQVLIFLCFFSTTAFSQLVTSIKFEGLKRTKIAYLNQFISTEVGDSLDSIQLQTDAQLLTNLEIFSNATFSVEKIGKDEFEVTFDCLELFTLLPIFNFGSIENNFWFQIGASEVNLFGKGNKILAYYQLYDRSSFATHFAFDRIKASPWGINLNIIKWGTLEPLFFSDGEVEYEYDNYTFGTDVIYHFNFFDKILFGGAYFTENYRAVSTLFDGAPARAETHKLLAKVIATRWKVNSHFFYLDGYSNDLVLETVQSLDGYDPFYIWFNDVKYFRCFGDRGNFASRLRVGLSSNQENPFAPFVLDSYLNIRGIGNRVDRGTGTIVFNVEYRYAFIEREVLAVQGVLFSDIGAWRNPGGKISDFAENESQVYFAGGGLRFINKKIYNAIFRIDYGFDLKSLENNGFVIGIGQYF
jgi:outer membrane protein insertion porin family